MEPVQQECYACHGLERQAQGGGSKPDPLQEPPPVHERFRACPVFHGVSSLKSRDCTAFRPSVLTSRPSPVRTTSSTVQRIWLKRKSCMRLFSKRSLSFTLAAFATAFLPGPDSTIESSAPFSALAASLSLRRASGGIGAFLYGHLFVHLFSMNGRRGSSAFGAFSNLIVATALSMPLGKRSTLSLYPRE